MKSILILDDQYTPHIYAALHSYFSDYTFPLADNIDNPMRYTDLVNKADIILLDNYFPSTTSWEEPKGCNVLTYLLEHNIQKKVICISDYKERLLDRYDVWQKAVDTGLVCAFTSKDTNTIIDTINHL